MPSDRAGARLSVALLAAVVALSVGLAGHFMLQAALRRSVPSVEEATRTGATAVGQAVAAQLSRALQFGIPLDRLPGVEPYLQRVVESSPQVDAMALLDGSGRTISATAAGVDGVRFPISGGGTHATLVVAAETPLISQAVLQARIALALTALLAGAVAGGLLAGFQAFQRQPAQRRLLADMDRVTNGDFTVQPPDSDSGPLAEAARALASCVEKVRAARQKLVEAVATIRAIDFDGSLGRQVETILQPLRDRYAFSESIDGFEPRAEPATGGAGIVWRLALLLGLYGAAFPYIANFAIDRESALVSAAWAPVVPMLVELIAAAVGVWLGRTPAGRSGALVGLGCLLFGVCTGATYWCREYDPFVLLRCGVGASAGFVAAALLKRPLSARPRQLAPVLIFAALLCAPLLASLYAEAIGRRSGFLLLGLAILIATPFIAVGRVWADGTGTPVIRRFGRSDLLLALITLPASAMILVVLPAGVGFDAYLAGGGMIALLAFSALLAPAMPPLASATVLAVAALVLAYPPVLIAGLPEAAVACILLGIAAGSGMKRLGEDAGRPWAALGLGAGAALVTAGAAGSLDLPFAATIAAAALLTAAAALPGRRPAPIPA